MWVILDLSRNQLGARCKTMLLTAGAMAIYATNQSQVVTLVTRRPRRPTTPHALECLARGCTADVSKIDHQLGMVKFTNSFQSSFIKHLGFFQLVSLVSTAPHLDSAWRCWYGTLSVLPSLVHGNHHGQ